MVPQGTLHKVLFAISRQFDAKIANYGVSPTRSINYKSISNKAHNSFKCYVKKLLQQDPILAPKLWRFRKSSQNLTFYQSNWVYSTLLNLKKKRECFELNILLENIACNFKKIIRSRKIYLEDA